MKKFIIGALVLLIGVPAFSFTFFNFLNFSAGLIPVLMILGGAIALYLGIEKLKQADKVELPERQPTNIIEENAGNSEEKSEPLLDKQDMKPAPEPIEKTEEKSTNKPDEQSDEQPEPEIQQDSASPSTLSR